MEPHSGLNNLDYLVVGVVLLSGLLALMRGLLRELFSLIAWVGAYFAAAKFYYLAVPYAHQYIKNDKTADWAAMGGVYLIALVGLMIVGHAICGLVKGNALTAIDRSLGFVYGLARGILVVSLIYLGASIILWPDIDKSLDTTTSVEDEDSSNGPQPPEMLLQAKTKPFLVFGAAMLREYIPKDMLDDKLKNAERQMSGKGEAAKQDFLDTISTPAPAGRDGNVITGVSIPSN